LLARAVDPQIDPAKLPGPMIDVCGTGGDKMNLFNVSTTSMFVLAAGVSVVYLIYERRLKAKRALGPVDSRAPSLEKLDRINYHLLGWGFLLLSLAIVSGAMWADATWGHYWSWEPQETWSLAIWILYAGLLESRLTVGWRGRRVAALTLIVFSILIGSFLGVSLLTPGKHGGSFG